VEVGIAEPGATFQRINEITERIGPRFGRSETRDLSALYLETLLKPVARKNCWQLAEVASENNPYGMQRLLCHAKWDADAVRDDLRDYVMEYLGELEGIGVIDETGFIKQGEKSVGVQRQYSGTAGKIENCQIGVFLVYVSSKGNAFLDRELYLPESWADNPARRKEAGVPKKIKFATKQKLAKIMLERAMKAGIRFSWITSDAIYGSNWELRNWLEKERQPYVLAVRSNQYVWWQDFRQWRVDKLADEVLPDAWKRLSIGAGSKGLRLYDWAWIRLPKFESTSVADWGRWLLVRRSIEKPDEIAYYLAAGPSAPCTGEAGPEGVSLEKLAGIAGKRWAIEMAFEEAKGEAGLDEYEVRKWESWYRHITLSLFAHAYLVVCRVFGDKKGAKIS
jgi:SRSO17 transposase